MDDFGENLSDEDFMKQELPSLTEGNEDTSEGIIEQEQEEIISEEESEESEEVEEVEQEEVTSNEESEDDENDASKEDDEPDDDSESEEEEDKDESDVESEPSEFEKKILAPFKANGREIKVNNADEAINLMQMGANYNKKMEAIKPSLKVVKLLEQHNLLDTDKLTFLIDLDKKNPQAISKLINDSGLNPLDLADEEQAEYKPEPYTVDETAMALDEVLDKIKDTETFTQTINVISKEWDETSQKTIAKDPTLIERINDQMSSGMYDYIADNVANQKAQGLLVGLSDFEAYIQTGNALHAKGDLAQFNEQEEPTQERKEVTPQKVKADKSDEQRKKKKRAAAPTKRQTKTETNDSDENPFSGSDEEFEKFFAKKFGNS